MFPRDDVHGWFSWCCPAGSKHYNSECRLTFLSNSVWDIIGGMCTNRLINRSSQDQGGAKVLQYNSDFINAPINCDAHLHACLPGEFDSFIHRVPIGN